MRKNGQPFTAIHRGIQAEGSGAVPGGGAGGHLRRDCGSRKLASFELYDRVVDLILRASFSGCPLGPEAGLQLVNPACEQFLGSWIAEGSDGTRDAFAVIEEIVDRGPLLPIGVSAVPIGPECRIAVLKVAVNVNINFTNFAGRQNQSRWRGDTVRAGVISPV